MGVVCVIGVVGFDVVDDVFGYLGVLGVVFVGYFFVGCDFIVKVILLFVFGCCIYLFVVWG